MPAYLIIEARITDPKRFGDYARQTPAVVALYGGRYVVMGGEQQSLEGDHAGSRTVVSVWPDRAAVLAFWHSPEYAAVKTLREGAGQFRVLLADGAATESLDQTNSAGTTP
ncbi:MAG: DUF1330 domain-containing protein [Pseudoxanthomonas sp.]